MAGLGTQTAIERAGLVTPRLPVRAPRFYPNNLLVRIWRGPGVGDCPGLLDSHVFARGPGTGVMSNAPLAGNSTHRNQQAQCQ